MLFEHEAPALDDVEKSLTERFGIHTEPSLKDGRSLDSLNLLVNLLISVDL